LQPELRKTGDLNKRIWSSHLNPNFCSANKPLCFNGIRKLEFKKDSEALCVDLVGSASEMESIFQ
jgi:hypothetical protein